MSDFDPHIDIENSIESRDGSFNIKDMSIGKSIKYTQTPLKVFDAKKMNYDMGKFIKSNVENPIFESWNNLRIPKVLKTFQESLEGSKRDYVKYLDSFFNIRKKLWEDSNTVLSLNFQKNPFISHDFKSKKEINGHEIIIDNHIDPFSWESFEYLLDYIHSGSSSIILVPDIKFDEFSKFEKYKDYIEMATNILSDYNSKPIFVPININIPPKLLDELIIFYKSRGFTNFWVNFNARQISNTQFARIRSLKRIIDRHYSQTLPNIYFSHVKKESNPHIQDERVAASNVIGPFLGCDFLGINRNPVRFIPEEGKEFYKDIFKNKAEENIARNLHKTRLFDPDTYFYYNIDKYPHDITERFNLSNLNLKNEIVNSMANDIILDNELNTAKEFISEFRSVNKYIKEKELFKKDIRLSKSIITGSSEQTKIAEFINKLI